MNELGRLTIIYNVIAVYWVSFSVTEAFSMAGEKVCDRCIPNGTVPCRDCLIQWWTIAWILSGKDTIVGTEVEKDRFIQPLKTEIMVDNSWEGDQDVSLNVCACVYVSTFRVKNPTSSSILEKKKAEICKVDDVFKVWSIYTHPHSHSLFFFLYTVNVILCTHIHVFTALVITCNCIIAYTHKHACTNSHTRTSAHTHTHAHTLPFLPRSNLLVSIPLSLLPLSPTGPEIINLFLHSSYVSTILPSSFFFFPQGQLMSSSLWKKRMMHFLWKKNDWQRN